MIKNISKILVVGDCHLGAVPYNLSEKRLDILENFHFIFNLFQKNNYDFIVFLGDLVESAEVGLDIWSEVTPMLFDIKDKILYIEGNHDRGFAKFFERLTKYRTEDGFEVNVQNELILKGFDYHKDHQLLAEKIKNIQNKENTILFLHANIYDFLPFLKDPKDTLSLNLLQGFQFTFNGHIHNNTYIEEIGFLNVGNIDKTNITESGDRKVFEVIFEDNAIAKIIEYKIPCRPLVEVTKREDIIKTIKENDSGKKPIIFFNGDVSQLTPADIIVFEEACLLFKIRNIPSRVMESFKNATEIVELKQIDLKGLLRQIMKKYSVKEEWIDVTLENYQNPNGLKEYIDSKYFNQEGGGND